MNARLIPLAFALLCVCAERVPAQSLPEDDAEAAPAAGPENAPPAQQGIAAPGSASGATADDAAALRKEIADLRRELRDALAAAQKTSPVELGNLGDGIAAINRRLSDLEKRVDTLVQDNRDLAVRVDRAGEADGSRVLANLNTDPAVRTTLVQAANPNAAVRLYNWDDEPKRMQVNGTWYNLKRRETRTVRVAYGPVTLTECEKKDPVTFSDWTPVDGGYVMIFDIGGGSQASR